MSLNEKYIINGSTLSDIGDALRAKEIISPTKEVSFTRWYRNDSGSAQSSYSSTTNHTAESDFYQGTYFEYSDIITKAKVIFTSIDSTVYLNGSGKTSSSIGKEFIVSYPFTTRIDGSIASPSMRYSYGCKIIPLNDNEEQLQLTEILTDRQPSSYLYTEEASRQVPNTIAVGDLAASILQAKSITIDYEGLSYSYITREDPPGFWQDTTKYYWTTFIPLTSGQKIGFCIGETVSTRLRAGFFQGKVYSDFQRYVTQPANSATKIYTGNVNITGTTELSGDGLLKRFYYTAPSDGELIVVTSNNSTSAPLHVWEV